MNQTGIAIVIKAWLPTGKGLDEQFAALSLVKTAHETGDYAPLLSSAKIEAVSTEQKTRRFEDVAPVAGPDPEQQRNAVEVPEGFYAVRDENGVATGEVLPIVQTSPLPPEPEPAATDDAIAERPDLETGTVTEPAAEPDLGIIETPKRGRKVA